MSKNYQFSPDSQAVKTQDECSKAVKKLIHAGNPKSNLFAMCLICNSHGQVLFAVSAVETMTRDEVLSEIQKTFDSMRKEINEEN